MRAFVTVVDTGSFSDAADRLRTSPQVVSKYVKALEQMLTHNCSTARPAGFR